MPHFPLKCEPLLVPKIWGGRRLQAVLGKRLPSRERIGEAWEVADIPEGLSRVADANGHAGTLRGLMEDHAEAVAPGNVNDRFPLLIKFLDASQNLSIQVHPGRRACEQLGPEAQSKEECWVVVHADPGASVLHGLRPGVGKIEIANAAGTASLPDLVRKVPIAPGDVLDVPAGTAHAISAGCVLMEVQQPSDTTYRLYDFDRQAQQDNDRPLHIEQALVALRTGNQGEPKIAVPVERTDWGTRELLIWRSPFTLERLRLGEPVAVSSIEGQPTVVAVLGGLVDVVGSQQPVMLRSGETCILPATLEHFELCPMPEASVVLVSPLTVANIASAQRRGRTVVRLLGTLSCRDRDAVRDHFARTI